MTMISLTFIHHLDTKIQYLQIWKLKRMVTIIINETL